MSTHVGTATTRDDFVLRADLAREPTCSFQVGKVRQEVVDVTVSEVVVGSGFEMTVKEQ